LEEEKRHVCLQGTAENCASTTLIGDPFELDLPTHIEVWLFPFPRLTWTRIGQSSVSLILAAGWFAIGDPLRKQTSRDIGLSSISPSMIIGDPRECSVNFS
jgi:hypothetical protein